MIPFADFNFFGLLLYLVIPTVLLGLFGRANARWALIATVAALTVQFSEPLAIRPGWHVRELWIVLGYLVYEGALTAVLLRWNSRFTFYAVLVLALARVVVAKFLPAISPDSALGFLGIS